MKKKGSALTAVLIMFSIIIMISTSMVTLTVENYKVTANNTNKIKKLYGLDSGLDAAYNIIVKTFDGAAKFGIIKCNEFDRSNVDTTSSEYKFINACYSDKGNDYLNCIKEIDEMNKKILELNDNKNEISNDINSLNKDIKDCEKSIKESEAQIEKLKDYEFKRSFINFIYSEDAEDENDLDKPSLLISSLQNLCYVSDVTLNKENGKINISNNSIKLDTKEQPYVYIDKDDNGIALNEDKNNLKVKIKSKFLVNNEEEEKVLQAAYTINIPERKDVSFSYEAESLPQYKAISDKVLVVNKDMTIEESDNLNINGNVYVCGEDKLDNNNIAYSKYYGGISLENSNANFQGDVITTRTFNTKDNSKCDIIGNLFAKNIYAGKENGDEGENSSLSILKNNNDEITDTNKNKVSGQAIIDNDITLKANNTNILIDKFYGINDKNIENKESLNVTSSSILVNGGDNSSVKINDEAYIMGVANIATEDGGYVTGESTGVKGNYIAYAEPVNSNDKFSKHEPLELLDSDDVSKKSEHFRRYWQDKLDKINYGGIELPDNTHSVGAIVYKDGDNIKIKQENMSRNDEDKVNEKRNQYAFNVYSPVTSDEKYDPTKSISNVFDNIVDFSNEEPIENYYIEDEENKKEKIIFNRENKKIEIFKDTTISNLYEIENNSDGIIIKTKNGDLDAVVVTNGDLIFNEGINFKGTILCNGNLNINCANNSEIKYDKSLVRRIQSDNKELFDKIFMPVYENKNEKTLEDKKNIEIRCDIDKFLKSESWKVIK